MARLTKRRLLLAGILVLCVAAVLFVPIPRTYTFSGAAEVTNKDDEEIGSCTLSVEACEIKSLVVTYDADFSIVLENNGTVTEFDTADYRGPNNKSMMVDIREDPHFLSFAYFDQVGEFQTTVLLYQEDPPYVSLGYRDLHYTLEGD